MIQTAIPQVGELEKKYLIDCIDSTFVSTVGPFVVEFEKRLSVLLGKGANAVAVNTGTAALHLGLKVLGVQKNDLVILPSLTFIASSNAISYLGAKPWFFDVCGDNWTIDVSQIEEALENETTIRDGKRVHKKTGQTVRCIMPVFTLGNPPDLSRLRQVAEKFQLPVLADAAAGLGATLQKQSLVDCVDLMTFSFNGNKTFTCGGGGAIVSKNDELIEKARHLSTTARVGSDYDHDLVGYNYRMPNVCAAVGLAQLDRFDDFIAKKSKLQGKYNELAKTHPDMSPFPEAQWGTSAHWLCGVLLENFSIQEVRQLILKLKESGVSSRLFWKPMHLQTPYLDCLKENTDVTESIWFRIFVLPCSTGLLQEEFEKTIESLHLAMTEVHH